MDHGSLSIIFTSHHTIHSLVVPWNHHHRNLNCNLSIIFIEYTCLLFLHARTYVYVCKSKLNQIKSNQFCNLSRLVCNDVPCMFRIQYVSWFFCDSCVQSDFSSEWYHQHVEQANGEWIDINIHIDIKIDIDAAIMNGYSTYMSFYSLNQLEQPTLNSRQLPQIVPHQSIICLISHSVQFNQIKHVSCHLQKSKI